MNNGRLEQGGGGVVGDLMGRYMMPSLLLDAEDTSSPVISKDKAALLSGAGNKNNKSAKVQPSPEEQGAVGKKSNAAKSAHQGTATASSSKTTGQNNASSTTPSPSKTMLRRK